MAKDKFKPLGVPPAALKEGGVEILRASVVNNGLHISMVRAFDDPQSWGMLIADVTRHAARIFARETRVTEAQATEAIRNMFDAEMDAPTDPGTTNAIS
jgi:hypothetical protein